MIDEFDNGKFVEIGIWRGQSVCYAAVEIINKRKNITIDAVDTWEGSPEEFLEHKDPHLTGTLYQTFTQYRTRQTQTVEVLEELLGYLEFQDP